jgi:hypothetical protein
MTRSELVLSGILVISLLFNVGVFIYARAAINRLLSVAEELWDLQQMVDSFAKHIQKVYELEMFYGDQTLQNLLDHAVSFNEQLETFEHVYSLIEEDYEDYDKNTEEETEQT